VGAKPAHEILERSVGLAVRLGPMRRNPGRLPRACTLGERELPRGSDAPWRESSSAACRAMLQDGARRTSHREVCAHLCSLCLCFRGCHTNMVPTSPDAALALAQAGVDAEHVLGNSMAKLVRKVDPRFPLPQHPSSLARSTALRHAAVRGSASHGVACACECAFECARLQPCVRAPAADRRSCGRRSHTATRQAPCAPRPCT
jgi:hypothetical protein